MSSRENIVTNNRNDGGPAFPQKTHGGIESHQYIEWGMSLRDYFAGKAVAGLIEGYDFEAREHSQSRTDRTGFDASAPDHDLSYAQNLAQEAYIIADAMLAERNK